MYRPGYTLYLMMEASPLDLKLHTPVPLLWRIYERQVHIPVCAKPILEAPVI